MSVNHWDQRYDGTEYIYGTDPNHFLVEQASRLPRHANILCLAEGEGRNAVWLAKQGHQVKAVDFSAAGLKKAVSLAKINAVDIETEVVDLADLKLKSNSYDAIVSIFAHAPPRARQNIHQQLSNALKPNGLFILEAYTPAQLQTSGRGGPPPTQLELFMTLEQLNKEITGLKVIFATETLREVNEGSHHSGTGAVVQLVAQKT